MRIETYIRHLRHIFWQAPVSKVTLLHERLKTPIDNLTPYGVFLEKLTIFGLYGVALTYIAWWVQGFHLPLIWQVAADIIGFGLICFVLVAYSARFRRDV